MVDSGRSTIGVRVRPNAHDFIRLLRQQLASKQYTFYVDVRARTGKATGDVREWARGPLQKINASVQVDASMGKANVTVADWRRKVAGQTATIGVNADMSAANREIAIWRNAVDRDITIRVHAKVAGKGVDGIRREVGRIGRQEFDVAPVVDKRSVKKVAKDVGDALGQDGLFSIEIDPKTKKAKAKISEFFADVQGEQGMLDLDLNIDTAPAVAEVKKVKAAVAKDPVRSQLQLDTMAARLELLKLRAEEKRRKLEVQVEVKAQKSNQIKKAIEDFEQGFGNINPIRTLDFGPVTLGKPSGLIGTLTTITALAGAVPGAVTGVSALAQAITQLAGAASLAPGAIGGLLAAVATIGVATSGVGDTFSSMFDMWSEGASEQASQANALVGNHNAYRNAVVDEAKAQRDVGRARRDALGDLRDLNNELRGSVLNEAQAILDAQKARDRYAQGGFDNETDRLQALLDIAKADENIITTREGNIRLQEKVNEANAQGVEGSDRVTEALEAQTRAAQATAQAAGAMAAATGSSGGAAQKFADSLAQLSPNAQEFINTFANSKGVINDFKLGIQDIFFAGLGPAAGGLMDRLLPTLEQGMGGLAGAMNGIILQVFDTIGSDEGQGIIERIFGGTTEAAKGMQQLVDPLVRGIGTLAAAGAEHLPQVVDLMTRLADRFAVFIEKADADGSLDEFLDNGVDALGKMAELGINVVQMVNNLGKAFKGDLLQGLVDLTGKWADWLGSTEGQNKIAEYAEEAKKVWEDWKPVLQDLPGIFDAIQKAAAMVLEGVTPFINVFSSFMDKYPGITQAFILTLLGAKAVTGIFGPIVSLFVGLGKALGGIAGFTTTIVSQLMKLTGFKMPGAPGILTTPGTTPAIVPGSAPTKPSIGAGLGLAATGVGAAWWSYEQVSEREKADQQTKESIDNAAKTLPPGIPAPETPEAQAAIKGGAAQYPGFKWVDEAPVGQGSEGRAEWARRYIWLMTHEKEALSPDFKPPVAGSYMKGGYTPWPKDVGKTVELHGREYVQPADVTSYYGVEGMEAIRARRIPKDLLKSFDQGGFNYDAKPFTGGPGLLGESVGGERSQFNPNMVIDTSTTRTSGPPSLVNYGGWGAQLRIPGVSQIPGSYAKSGQAYGPFAQPGPGADYGNRALAGFETGGLNDPNAHLKPTPLRASEANPAGGGILSALNTGIASIPGVVQQVQGMVPGVGTGPAPGPAPAVSTGIGTGPLPGPVGGTGTVNGVPNVTSPTNMYGDTKDAPGLNLFGINIPFGGQQPIGWGTPDGKPPVGLGGGEPGPNGEAPLDIRKYGIGPGPVGSNPDDWAKFAAQTGGDLISGVFANAFQGILGFFGLENSILSPSGEWGQHVFGTAAHFLKDGSKSGDSSVQGAGAGQTNADVTALLETYGSMPLNPADGGYTQMPMVFDQAGSAIGVGASAGANPGSKGSEAGLQVKTIAIKRVLEQAFPGIRSIGGYRQDPLQWHPSGRALDVMVSAGGNNDQPTPPDSKALGDAIYAWATGPMGQAMGVYPAGTLWQVKDHFNHVHVALLDGGGYPDGSGPTTQDSSGKAAGPTPAETAKAQAATAPPAGTPLGDLLRQAPAPATKAPAPPTKSIGDLLGNGGANTKAGDPFAIPQLTRDQGGIIPPGTSVVHNYTGRNELVVNPSRMHHLSRSFAVGGFNMPTGAIVPKPPPAPPVQALPKIAKPAPTPAPAPAQRPSAPAPRAAVPAPSPGVATPPPAPSAPAAPAAPPPSTGPGGAPISTAPRPATGGGPGADSSMHLHPAAQKGITSGFAAAGNAAAAAASMGSMGAGGGMGGLVQGLFGQAGKIATNIANVGASFLVGNITGGTTENAYGVTQRGGIPSGGTKVYDGSTTIGSIQTANLDEYYRRENRREAQKAQSSMGRWGNA